MKKTKPYKLSGIIEDFKIQYIVQSSGYLKIVLIGNEKNKSKNVILFDSCLACRILNESHRLKFLRDIEESLLSENILVMGKSEYIKWFVNENLGVYKEDELTHYIIFDSEYVIDVISISPPKLQELDYQQYKLLQNII